MDETKIFLMILGMGMVTYLPRLLPAWLLRGRQMPDFVVSWLKYIPVAILAALLFPSLVIQDGRMNLSTQNLYLWAAIPAIFTAWKTKNMFATVIVGMVIVALARLFIGG